MQQEQNGPTEGISVDTAVQVQRPVREVFAFWRALENFPSFMSHVKEVRPTEGNRYLWRVSGPVGTEVSWEAEVTEAETDVAIGWQSLAGSTIANRGRVTFLAQSPNATEIRVHLTYDPPAGVVGHAVATMLGVNPRQQMEHDLQRCKQLLEEGAVESGKGEVSRQDLAEPSAPVPT